MPGEQNFHIGLFDIVLSLCPNLENEKGQALAMEYTQTWQQMHMNSGRMIKTCQCTDLSLVHVCMSSFGSNLLVRICLLGLLDTPLQQLSTLKACHYQNVLHKTTHPCTIRELLTSLWMKFDLLRREEAKAHHERTFYLSYIDIWTHASSAVLN